MDQRLTRDIERLCNDLSALIPSMVKPVVDILWCGLQCLPALEVLHQLHAASLRQESWNVCWAKGMLLVLTRAPLHEI